MIRRISNIGFIGETCGLFKNRPVCLQMGRPESLRSPARIATLLTSAPLLLLTLNHFLYILSSINQYKNKSRP